MEFAHRTALVTGASQGIGRATCLRLASGGARLAVHYHSNEKGALETVAGIRDLGGSAFAVQADLAATQDVASMCAKVEAELGPVELLVNNAGRFSSLPPDRESAEHLLAILRDNLHTTFITTWAAKDSMLKRRFGRIVNIASTGAFFRTPGMGVTYGVAKAGVIALTKGWAGAWGSYNVRVNCVAPGFIDTDANADLDPAVQARIVAQTPLARAGTPSEVADTIAYLLSEAASFINGQTLAVCGGRVMLP